MKLHRVHQRLVSNPLADPIAEVRKQLDALTSPVPQGPIAITAGSRGICNLPAITRAAGDWLREQGADPFLVPAMGSHNGATAEGQQSMLESLGLDEASMGMPIRSSMECVQVGEVATGKVWMDRHCWEAAGVLLLNRVKLHTCFAGPYQSGLIKMLVVGMGKVNSARTFHSAPTPQMAQMLVQMGKLLIDSGKVWAGLAILEDGLDETAELHALAAADILEQEPGLVDRHRDYFPRLPIDEINTLIVGEMGKTFSGTGMDPNVIGRRGVAGLSDIERPNIRTIGALKLTPASQGNAIGVGLADFITRPLRDAIDEEKTFINTFTTGEMDRAKIPVTLANDEQLCDKIAERFGSERWMLIPNTLHLDKLYVSEDLVEEVRENPICEVLDTPVELAFRGGQLDLGW